MSTQADIRYPVSLILGRSWQYNGHWKFPRWEVVATLPYQTSPGSDGICCHDITRDKSSDNFLWSGLWFELFRDGLQGYYQNLTGQYPSLFILCHSDDSGNELNPIAISGNHADAEAHMESDGIVLETPLISPFSGWLADYILENQAIFEQQLADSQRSGKGNRSHVRQN